MSARSSGTRSRQKPTSFRVTGLPPGLPSSLSSPPTFATAEQRETFGSALRRGPHLCFDDSGDSHDHLNLHRDVVRKAACPQGAANVLSALAKYFSQEIRRTVDYLRLSEETGG